MRFQGQSHLLFIPETPILYPKISPPAVVAMMQGSTTHERFEKKDAKRRDVICPVAVGIYLQVTALLTEIEFGIS